MIIDTAIKLLRCPECLGSQLILIELPEIDGFTEAGALVCDTCKELFLIHNSILSLLRAEFADREKELAFLSVYSPELPKESVAKRVLSLKSRSSGDEVDWVLSEKSFWNSRKYSAHASHVVEYNWNRFEVRRRHITCFLDHDMSGKVAVEFGSGNSGTLFHVLNPEKLNYTLICTDISYNALISAKRHHPKSVLIQCNCVDPPFTENIFDVVFEFGVLHHLPDNELVIQRHIDLLKDGGYLALHEPIDRRPGMLSSFAFLKRISCEQSQHNDTISESKTIALFERKGRILHRHIEYSPVRNWMTTFFIDFLKINTRWMHFTIIAIDQFVIQTIGRVFNRMDGSLLLALWQKKR